MSETAVPSSSELALTGQFPPMDFRNLQDLTREVDAKREKLQRQDVSQYIAYKQVSSAQFDYIEANRMQLGAVRFTYFSDINTLIVKVPTRPHEIAHRNLGRQVVAQVERMNITIDEFLCLGSTIYTGPTVSKKEGDSAFTNPALRPNATDWPTLVIEAGLSESMPRLRQDAAWWIGNSLGRVPIVLVVEVARSARTMTIEKYMPSRANTTPSFQPSLVSTTVVNDDRSNDGIRNVPRPARGMMIARRTYLA